MARIKQTKAELKAQREALHRYQRFLPSLQLKKEQLQSEVRRVQAALREVKQTLEDLWAEVDTWKALFAEEVGLQDLIQIQDLHMDTVNVVGVTVRRYRSVHFARITPDLIHSPPWVDTGVDRVKKIITQQIQSELLHQELKILNSELRTATQRVNLFEKIKIQDCRENIRIIRIALGEEQTAAIARAKLAKSKAQEWSTGA